MKLAYVASPKLFSPGASSIEVMRLAEAMGKVGFDVELVVPHNIQNNGSSKKSIFEHYGVNPNFKLKLLHSAPGLSLRHFYHGLTSALYTYVNRDKYDLVFSRNIFYALLSSRVLRIPTIFDAHHPIDSKAGMLAFKLLKDSDKLLKFVVISDAIAQMCLEQGLPKEKLTVAPNAVDIDRFNVEISTEEARRKLGLPLDKTIISHIGNIYAGRGIELLIDVSHKFPDALILIVGGEESDINKYKTLAVAQGAENVIFTGFIPPSKVSLYFFATDVLTIPYTTKMTTKWGRIETNCASLLKLAEYMASRRPIVSTNIPAIASTLKDGVNSVLIRPDSVSALEEGIRKVIGDKKLANKIARQAALDSKHLSLENRVSMIFGDSNISI